jgi:hypothetical protein
MRRTTTITDAHRKNIEALSKAYPYVNRTYATLGDPNGGQIAAK